MSANFENKKLIVEEIKKKISESKIIVFVDYKGINVAQDTELRAAARKAGADYKVYKNRLLALALKDLGIEGMDTYLNGTTAVAFGYNDEISAPKIMNDFAKKVETFNIKVGILDNKIIDDAEVIKLASIPSREVLIATLLRTLNNPVASLARALDAIASKQN